MIVVKTSLVVYLAAGLIDFLRDKCLICVADPKFSLIGTYVRIKFVKERTAIGLSKLVEELLCGY
ncbi:MAG: hypothetical protein GYA55_06200 [SAR324 cluster bacterium]|uniref:Uncharacterized protein n=1 Tax=SAR324 cluster bacterium TaxID=2024889 RepID=A0A7X9FRD1_9DELT|nr:hypothetical protein [SAR324 cluster bacterium]